MSPGLARVIFWIAAISCAVAHVALIRAVLASLSARSYPEDRRKGPRRGGMRFGPDRRSAPSDQLPSASREMEIGWAVLPALGLLALLAGTWLALPD